MQELYKIEDRYPNLSSTGCSSRFCQSGRMIHTDEPRVGKDRPLHEIEADATDLLRQMRRESLVEDDVQYQNRLREILTEIRNKAVISRSLFDAADGISAITLSDGLSSQGWSQSIQEIEFGIRAAWKHSRKCIMRSQYHNLRLCDLRHIETATGMGSALVRSLEEAFNQGDILPTVFLFPARKVGKSGPMIWNQQLLAFAGYTNDDGSVLGDPLNASLTTSIIDLGWKPPIFRTKWDLLPLVTMTDNDAPVITSLSEEAFPLVHIRHPRYQLPFEKLGLRWVPAPALSRLGFDIGGMQYTASPFVGWFMDAEIGIRDLADESRYNVLPDIVKELYSSELGSTLEQLPEYKRLALLARAQAELNFAVYYSYSQDGIRMSDTLSASYNYCQFDDEHFQQHGFRLPADPYWLAPPQGSIIPIWHRGGAPHYQPKPMICRHREDPVKAWKRRRVEGSGQIQETSGKERKPDLRVNGLHVAKEKARTRFFVQYCSSGAIAAKLAGAVHKFLQDLCFQDQLRADVRPASPLDSLNLANLTPDDTIIIVASSTGRGDIPSNGHRTVKALQSSQFLGARFTVFGNGDSSYADSFNAAARTIYSLFQEAGFRPLSKGYAEADNSKESPPWDALNAWLKNLPQGLCAQTAKANSFQNPNRDHRSRTKDLVGSFTDFKVAHSDVRRSLKKVVLQSSERYMVMDYLLVLAPNTAQEVRQVLRTLRKSGHERIASLGNITYFEFLQKFVELKQPFMDLRWAAKLEHSNIRNVSNLPVPQALATLPSGWQKHCVPDDVLRSMPSITPRTFSVASAPGTTRPSAGESQLELLVETRRNGKFSEQYLDSAQSGSLLRGRIKPATSLRRLLKPAAASLVAFVTGSGFAPMQSLLRFRLAEIRKASSEQGRPFENQISLFIGFRPADTDLIQEGVAEAVSANLFDMLLLTPSNYHKIRSQDKVFQSGVRERVEAKIKNGAYVFVCANPMAAEGIAQNLGAVLGCDVRKALGERYVQDSFGSA